MRAINGYKTCSVCGETKPVGEYGKQASAKDGLRPSCKACRHDEYLRSADVFKARSNERYYAKKEEISAKNKEYRRKHAERYREHNANYYKVNSDKIKAHVKEYHYQRINNDAAYKVLQLCRTRLYKAVRGHVRSAKTRDLIGCDVDFLMDYLASMFQDGMSWGNYGKWHIDHIRPCASFDLSIEDEQRKCFHYTNLQPLWAEDNLRKNDKYEASY